MPNHLIALYQQEGQSPWLDNLKRSSSHLAGSWGRCE